MPSSHYMHSPIIVVNELPLLTLQCNYSPTKNIHIVPSYAEPSRMECTVLDAEWCRLLVWQNSTSRNGTLRMVQSLEGGDWLCVCVAVYVL